MFVIIQVYYKIQSNYSDWCTVDDRLVMSVYYKPKILGVITISNGLHPKF